MDFFGNARCSIAGESYKDCQKVGCAPKTGCRVYALFFKKRSTNWLPGKTPVVMRYLAAHTDTRMSHGSADPVHGIF